MAAWNGMASMPFELIEEILMLSDLEIPESLFKRLPRDPPVREWARSSKDEWYWESWVYTHPRLS
jgi:hypothetical protein